MRRMLLTAVALLLPACSKDPTVGAPEPDFALSAPANDAIGVTGVPTFRWTPSPGTESYRLQVASDSGFTTLVVDRSGIADTSLAPAVALDPGTAYSWRVLAERPSGDVLADGAPWTFTTLADTPGDFTLTSPAAGDTDVPLTPTFTWSPSLGTAGYRLQVATDPGFTTLVSERAGLTTTSATPNAPLAPSTLHYWRVIAESTSTTTATGAPFSFTTTIGGPATFTLLSPTNAATAVSTLPTFSWNPSSGATSYRLQVSPEFTFTTLVVDQSNILGLTATPSTALQSGTTYYWRVYAESAGGTVLASPSPYFFTTA